MKTQYLTICLSLVFFINYAQISFDEENGSIEFERIDQIDLSQDKIKKSTLNWFAKTFKDANSVIKAETDDYIIGKGNFTIESNINKYTFYPIIYFTLEVAFKEGRYRIKIDNFNQSLNGIETNYVYFSEFSYEKYYDFTKSQIIQLSDGTPGKQMALKRLDNKKKSMKDYELQKENMKRSFDQIKEQLENISISLNAHLKKTKKDDW